MTKDDMEKAVVKPVEETGLKKKDAIDRSK